ncbi:hypothetical protein DVJ83_06090 [Deinococcus wulumuqiensis]|uniref:Uncharacterized protein n=1 Tax=Deinococcus wulumuqiensis TaxID=980427 RepID=A0A345IGI4_9DEIO|nr:hypothetical protein DVJ83_06090 [Deinococcus wulumuqiensis]
MRQCRAVLRTDSYGFRLIPAQSGKRRLCIHIAESPRVRRKKGRKKRSWGYANQPASGIF